MERMGFEPVASAGSGGASQLFVVTFVHGRLYALRIVL